MQQRPASKDPIGWRLGKTGDSIHDVLRRAECSETGPGGPLVKGVRAGPRALRTRRPGRAARAPDGERRRAGFEGGRSGRSGHLDHARGQQGGDPIVVVAQEPAEDAARVLADAVGAPPARVDRSPVEMVGASP